VLLLAVSYPKYYKNSSNNQRTGMLVISSNQYPMETFITRPATCIINIIHECVSKLPLHRMIRNTANYFIKILLWKNICHLVDA